MKADTFFKALADQTRLRCVVLLAQEGELCVCELTHALGVAQPKVSRHLAALREAGLVVDRRQGYWIYYRMNPALPDWAREVVSKTVVGVADGAPFVDDRLALAVMADRPARCT